MTTQTQMTDMKTIISEMIDAGETVTADKVVNQMLENASFLKDLVGGSKDIHNEFSNMMEKKLMAA